MAQTVMNDTVNPLFLEQIMAAKVKADQEGEECLDAYICDERAKAKAAANHNALIFYNETLANLKAEASERSECEITKFKSSLKVRNEECKAALLADFEKCAPKPSSQPTSTANQSSHRKTHVDPTACPLPPSRPASRSHSCTPSPEPRPSGCSPDMTTPCAPPVVELPLTRSLTEPALSPQPLPTDILVGPPLNSFETAMCQVDTTSLQAVEYPHAPSVLELYGPPNTQQTISSPQSSFAPPTSSIESLIRRMSESFLAQVQQCTSEVSLQVSLLSLRLE